MITGYRPVYNFYSIHPCLYSKILNDNECSLLYVWCKLSIHKLITSRINTIDGISVSAECVYGTDCVNIIRPAVVRIYYGRDLNSGKFVMNKKKRMSYGVNFVSHDVGADPNKFITKPFNYHLHKIADYIYNLLITKRVQLDLQTVDLTNIFNHCTKLLYYAGDKLKKCASMGFHTDITYNHDGIYMKAQNGQKENTPTVIVVIGDNRNLFWERQVLITSEFGKKKWVTDTSFNSVVTMRNLSILIVNPLDEITSYDQDLGVIVRYRHGGVKVSGFKMSIGFVFRVVTRWAEYDINHRMSHFNQQLELGKAINVHGIDIELFHQELIKLYNSTFKV